MFTVKINQTLVQRLYLSVICGFCVKVCLAIYRPNDKITICV